MQTVIHQYNFDTSETSEAAQYKALRATLTAQHLKCFESHGGASHYNGALNGKMLTLETAHLFANQWNTAPIDGDADAKSGRRVFDWAQDSVYGTPNHNPLIKRGHWLEQTAEMSEARRNTAACGYCGHQEPAQKGNIFCPECIGSEYLETKLLHLLRMQPVENTGDRAPLTDAERAHLLPLYRDAQLHGHTARDKTRIAQVRADIVYKFETATRNAKAEHDGMLWLLTRGFKSDNVIFYTHTGRFGFGWRAPVDAEILSGLLDIISEFPFAYDIVTDDDRKLSS